MSEYKFQLLIIPAVEADRRCKVFSYRNLSEAIAAKDTCADMLLFIQDKLRVMRDYSNVFIIKQMIDDEWVELNEDELTL